MIKKYYTNSVYIEQAVAVGPEISYNRYKMYRQMSIPKFIAGVQFLHVLYSIKFEPRNYVA